jgi:hypothetical protein
MSLQLMFSYKVAFKHIQNTIPDLIKEIPSKVILYYLSLMNSRIQRDSDQEVFAFASRRWPQNKIDFIVNAKTKYETDNQVKSTFFSEWIVTEFIKYELLHFRDFAFELEDTTVEHEINLYLAYLLYVDVVLEREEINYPKDDKINFQELIWPLGIYQFEFINYKPPIFDAIRVEVFFWNLMQEPKYAPFLEAYLKKFNVRSSWALISMYINVMKWIMEKQEGKGEFFFLYLETGDIHTALFEHNLIDITEYQASEEKQKYFIGLKEKPLYKYKDDTYLILNSKFLLNQIYNGLLFDFFKTSGISALFAGSFPNFKSTQSFTISEKILFRKSINILFEKKRFTTIYPDSDKIIDAYVRDGKYIYLFEFKDASVALSLVDTRKYDEFENNLKRNFIENEKGSPKGINQLLNSIKQIIDKPFGFDDFNLKGIKTRNVVIFPIIVYTDYYYSMYGVNEYLERKLLEAIDFDYIGVIKPLTMISLNFLVQHGELISKGDLKGIIDRYHEWRNKIEKKMHRHPNMQESFKVYSSIEHSPQSQIQKHEKEYTAKFINVFLDHLPK